MASAQCFISARQITATPQIKVDHEARTMLAVLGSPGIRSFCQAHNIKLLANLVNLANLAANPATQWLHLWKLCFIQTWNSHSSKLI